MENPEEIATQTKTPIIARYWFGALLGTAIGFISGVLLAPRAGRETRSEIQNTVNHASEEAQEKIGDIKDTISNRVTSVKECLSGAVDDTKHDLQNAYSEVKKSGKEIKEEIKDTVGAARK